MNRTSQQIQRQRQSNSSTSDFLVRFQDISTYFSPDAWQLVISFLINLQEKLEQFNISMEQQTTVFNGIEEFIQEFIEEYRDNGIINFENSIELIGEIGSPSEILQAIEVSIEEIKSRTNILENPKSRKKHEKGNKLLCRYCSWANESDARFCENCGRKIYELVEATNPIQLPQAIINHPFKTSILLSYLALIILGSIGVIISPLSSPSTYSYNQVGLGDFLGDILQEVIGPAIVLGLILGFLIKWIYREERSTKYRSMAIRNGDMRIE